MKLKNSVKPFVVIVGALLFLVVFVFVAWQIQPKKKFDIAILDKTVPAANHQSQTDISGYKRYYRKHMGLNWILKQQKYVKPSDKSYYDHKSDYYGPIIDDNGNVLSTLEMSSSATVPDMVYLADAYGSELYGNDYSGITQDDMGAVSLAYSKGATIVAEMELGYDKNHESVKNELNSLCGIADVKWRGRYIYELQDFTDVPEWAPPAYEKKYGVEWKFAGPGILLASNEGDIIVLEEKTDFNSKNLLSIYVTDQYKKEFKGTSRLNFYNWFELITPESGTETIASFEFDLNATGMEKFKEISSSPVFAAVTRKQLENSAPVYYFAGDFCDYVQEERVNSFLFADYVYKMISFERDGDISNFFWNFYTPLVKKILKDAYNSSLSSTDTSTPATQSVSRISGNSFEVQVDGKWQKLKLKAFNINPYEAGDDTYSRDFVFYRQLFSEMAQIGANCVKTYDILPPEFYRALYESNHIKGRQKIYLIQTVPLPKMSSPAKLYSQEGINHIRQTIDNSILAVHGKGKAAGTEFIYNQDVSDALLGFIIDPDITPNRAAALSSGFKTEEKLSYTYSSGNATEKFLASLSDYLLKTHKEKYGYLVPCGIKGNQELITKAAWSKDARNTFTTDAISVSEEAKPYFFSVYSLSPADKLMEDYQKLFNNFSDKNGKYLFGGYIQRVKSLQNNHPVLISDMGVSTNVNMFEKSTLANGFSEEAQGNEIVRMLSACDKLKVLGGVISDFNDSWAGLSDEFSPFTIPAANNKLWHNLADPAETSGVIAADAVQPQEVGMELIDTERMQKVQFYSNAEYLYLTILFNSEINYDKEQLFIGLDTYQRNDGEYLFDKKYYANSLSGMEFVIKFESKVSAGLYIVSSYNRNNGKMSTKESYKASLDLVTQLNYGNFSESNTQFYQAGTSLRIRIPWSLLNVTDPSQRIVINGLKNGQIQTTYTNGLLFYLFVGDKSSKDTKYIFPLSKKATGYKVFSWGKWEKAEYTLRRKASFDIIAGYFGESK